MKRQFIPTAANNASPNSLLALGGHKRHLDVSRLIWRVVALKRVLRDPLTGKKKNTQPAGGLWAVEPVFVVVAGE